MRPLNIANKLLPGILFLLLTAFSPLLPCAAVEIIAAYSDDGGEGFEDETDLTQAQKDLISTSGNNAATLGEARKKAFEYAASLLGNILTHSTKIKIEADFVVFEGQKDSNDPPGCRSNPSSATLAAAGPESHVSPLDRRIDLGNGAWLSTVYPCALYEALYGNSVDSCKESHIGISFSKCVTYFYYGLTTGPTPTGYANFVNLSLHEIMHGLGFFEYVRENGNFPIAVPVNNPSVSIELRTIYDEQLYSEADGELLVDLTDSERAAAITSKNGHLLWEGTDADYNANPCSYGQRMAELKIDSAKVDGKPKLHAPSTYNTASSVSHTHANAQDLMEAVVSSSGSSMDLTLGMLKDMGWEISAEGFPSDCEPSGIAVTPEEGLVTTELGGKDSFEVKLDSEPAENVVVSITSDDEYEGVPDPNPLELTFTPLTWNTPQEVTIVGVDDDSQDGPQDYDVEIKVEDSDDRFYAVVRPKLVPLRNEDDDFLPQLFIDYADAEEKDGVLDFPIDLSDTTANTVTVQYEITGTTAQEGIDYAAAPPNAAVTLAPGEKETTISVPLIYDNLDEYPDVETLTVTLSSPQGATLAQNGSTATATIRDSDQATLRIDDASAGEGNGSMNFAVRLSPQSVRTVTTQYVITGNTAQADSDYEAASATGTITFAPEQAQNTIGVSLVDDGDQEANEIFTVMLFNPQNAVLAPSGDTATGTIRDNDQPRPPPPPPPRNNQIKDDTQLPLGTTPQIQRPKEENPQKPSENGGGGGGCAIASGGKADHGRSTPLNLLAIVSVVFPVFFRKNRLIAR